MLLDFWGSWCVPCVDEIPYLLKVHEKFGDRGLVMISISNDASVSKWDRTKLAEYTEKKGMKWFQVLDDTSNTIHDFFHIRFWPNMFLIDREGRVLGREGRRSSELMDVLSTLLKR